MPMKPHKDEDKTDFMARCVPDMMGDGKRPNDQAVAACMAIWGEAHGEKPKNISELIAFMKTKLENMDGWDDDYDEGYDFEGWMSECTEVFSEETCHMMWEERSKKVPVQKLHVSEGTGFDFILSDEAVDRLGDVVSAGGWDTKAFSQNPICLFNHDSDFPIGNWSNLRVEKGALRGKLELASVGTSPRIDEIRALVDQGILRAVSVGFLPLKSRPLEKGQGRHYAEQELLEASLVSVPANRNALRVVKSLGTSEATQKIVFNDQGTGKQSKTAGASVIVKLQEAKMAKKSIAEQIAGFEATRAAKHAKMTEIMETSADKGETLDAEEKQAYDELAQEVKSVDEHLERLRVLEKSNISKAAPVEGKDLDDASKSRGTVRVEGMKSRVPAGILFTRDFLCRAHARLNGKNPLESARELGYFEQTPELETILKAPIAVGTTTGTTWALPLVEPQFMRDEFIKLLTPLTIIGRMPGLRRVPFNIKIPRETTAASVTWVGEGKVKPVSAMAFDSVTMGFTKIAGIVPVTEELFRFSNPAIETLVRDSLLEAVSQLSDRDFLDPTKAAVVGVSPASITNGVVAHTASGATADALRADLGSMLATYAAANMSMAGLVLIMTSQQAIRISLMRNTLGTREFEGLTPNGGSLEGIPVVVSENIVTSGSPAGGLIIAVNAPEVFLADDGQVAVDISREASLQMESAPDSPATASTVMVSLWQHNMVGIRAERGINWMKRRAGAVQYIEGANYS